jgi:hypothetical protein
MSKNKYYKGRLGLGGIGFFLSNISVGKTIAVSLAVAAVCLVVYFSYLLHLFVHHRIDTDETRASRINEYITPLRAEIELLKEEISDLKAHSVVIYYKPKKRPRNPTVMGGMSR